MNKSILWCGLGGVAIVALLVSGSFLSGGGNLATVNLSNREVAMVCTTDMATKFHIHLNLKIFVKGEEHVIPASIGVRSGCMNPLHTHTPDGIIHIESPEARDFALGDFFAVWNKNFMEFGPSVQMTVNGGVVTELENYPMKDGDKIELRYE